VKKEIRAKRKWTINEKVTLKKGKKMRMEKNSSSF
jgi:hypothetical protein